MAKVLWHDGFGQYADLADLQARSGIVALTGSGVALVTGVRAGAKDVQGASTWSQVDFRIAITPVSEEGVVAARVRVLALTATGGGKAVFSIRNINDDAFLTLTAETDGSLQLRRGESAGTVLATSAAGVLTITTRYFIELMFVLHGSLGLARARVNGVTVCEAVDVNTMGTTGNWRQTYIGLTGDSIGVRQRNYGDIHITDATGGLTFLGDCQTDFHAPDANGAVRNWTRSTGSDDYSLLAVPRNDTTYLHSTTVDEIVTVNVEALKRPGAAVLAVTPLLALTKVDAGPAVVQHTVRHSGTNYFGNDLAPSAGVVRWIGDTPLMTNPGTGVDWTEAGFNAIEIGVKKVG